MKSLQSRFIKDSLASRSRLVLLGIAVLVMLWDVVAMCNTIGLTPVEYTEFEVICVLLVLIPWRPAPIALTILGISAVFGLRTMPDYYSTFLLGDASSLFACFIIGTTWGKPRRIGIAVSVSTLVILVMRQLHLDVVYGYCYLLWEFLLAWLIGAIAHHTLELEYRYGTVMERDKQRERQLQTMHVLHDTVANNLVYGIMQCRAIRTSDDGQVQLGKVQELQSTLEDTLCVLRTDVITPIKNETSEQADHGARAGDRIHAQSSSISSAATLEKTIQRCQDKLDQCGFHGSIELDTGSNSLTAAECSMVSSCIAELSGNIMKHGAPGEYVIALSISADDISIVSSNQCAEVDGEESTEWGMALLRRQVDMFDGSVNAAREANEWSVHIEIPRRSRD